MPSTNNTPTSTRMWLRDDYGNGHAGSTIRTLQAEHRCCSKSRLIQTTFNVIIDYIVNHPDEYIICNEATFHTKLDEAIDTLKNNSDIDTVSFNQLSNNHHE